MTPPHADGIAEVLEQFNIDPTHLAGTAAVRLAPPLAELLASAADPAMALANWERFAAAPHTEAVTTCTPEELQALFAVFGGAQSLANTLLAASSDWLALLRRGMRAESVLPAAHVAALGAAIEAPWAELALALRQHRHREYVRIGMCDLTHRFAVDDTVRELSALADGCFEVAAQWARRTVAAEYGALILESGAPNPFVVLGMGKLGGEELNYSSDVDVIYLYGQDGIESAGGPRGSLAARAYFTRVAELVTRAMQEITDAGFVFRVDLRLRPDGVNGPVANPLGNALLYYESWGQTWERTALIKARPVAGDLVVGEQFLIELRPFVYRSYLDFATVKDMQEMKSRVGRQHSGKSDHANVKLGSGGIREIEFVAQVLQLIYGGRDERLRVLGTLPTLRRLGECGYLPHDEVTALSEAYRFLRDVEHKIQIVHERHTQTLPAEPRDQLVLARRMGFQQARELLDEIERRRDVVRKTFAELFQEQRDRVQRGGEPEAVLLFRELDIKDASLERLRALGFSHPAVCYDDLRLLRDGGRAGRQSPRRLQALNALAPTLISLVRRSVAPDRALHHFASFVQAVGARTSFLSLLQERPATLEMLVNLFAASEMLSTAFIRHPEMLDSLVRADVAQVSRPRRELEASLAASLAAERDYEAELDVLRRFRHEEFLRIGINDLQGAIDVTAVSEQLSVLAEVCLGGALTIAERLVEERYGVPVLPGKIAIVALGKLGSAELNYHSDLDLIFIYDSATTDGHEMFSRLVQRLLSVLQVPTREGLVYRIDTRLRPSGRAGPLVSSLASFAQYHASSARIWERQALIRARAVGGAPDLCETVEGLIGGFVYRDALGAKGVREIRHLRARMERELARESRYAVNIKTGRGALVDIEFLVQMLQLVHGHARSELRVRGTRPAIEALRRTGVLPPADAAVLADGYAFLRRLENRLRIGLDQAVETLQHDSPALRLVARQMGFEGADAGAQLWQEYEHRREIIRECFDRWFETAAADSQEAAVDDG